MEKLRTPPYDDLTINFVVPDSYTEETDFYIKVTDLSDLSETITDHTGEEGDSFSYTLPAKYDNDYRIEFDSVNGENVPIYDDTIELVRPYAVPSDMATTASEIAEYTKYEEIARAVIDSIIPEGFYYKKRTLEVVGLGADYIPLWIDAKRILKVYENNVLIYDVENEEEYARHFEITADKTAITQKYSGIVNRFEGAKNVLPAGGTDFLDLNFTSIGAFPKGYDYKIVVEAGYTVVPSDIQRAAKLLIEDISCGKLEYYKRYISAYNTDQYKIQFDKMIFEGTGNILVDKILSKYVRSISRLGVL
jgi:hypothetical protein